MVQHQVEFTNFEKDARDLLRFALCLRQHYIYIGILSDSVGTSHLRLIGKKRRKHQPRG